MSNKNSSMSAETPPIEKTVCFELDDNLVKVVCASTLGEPLSWKGNQLDGEECEELVLGEGTACSVIQIAINIPRRLLYIQGHEPLECDSLENIFSRAQDMLPDDDDNDENDDNEVGSGGEEDRESSTATEFCFVLIRVDCNSNTPNWVVINYLTDVTPPHKRLMFFKARAALEERLIASNADFFNAEHYLCTTKSQLTYKAFQEAKDQRSSTGWVFRTRFELYHLSNVLSEKDAAYRKYLMINEAYPNNLCLAAAPSFKTTLSRYPALTDSCLMMAVDIKNLCVTCDVLPYNTIKSLQNRLYSREPRYYLVRLSKASQSPSLFFLSCPDGSTKYSRILYASCKSAVFNMITSSGIEVKKSLDVRNSTSDLSESAIVSAPDFTSKCFYTSRTNARGLQTDRRLTPANEVIPVKPRPPVNLKELTSAPEYFPHFKRFDFATQPWAHQLTIFG